MTHSATKASCQLLVIIVSTILSGCSLSAPPSKAYQLLSTSELPKTLAETSGLYCFSGKAATINDSGNTPELFLLDENGAITHRDVLDVKNQDWESITGTQSVFYVGDIGSNAGKRETLYIHKVNRSDPKDIHTTAITYKGNLAKQNAPYAHDYDGEAMTVQEGRLLLFSKSWGSGVSHVYDIDTEADSQELVPFANIEGLPGVVTGADYSEQRQQFALVGYTSNALGMFNPFIALVDKHFNVVSVDALDGFAQVEGVCFADKNTLWLTQEDSPYSSAKLIKLRL